MEVPVCVGGLAVDGVPEGTICTPEDLDVKEGNRIPLLLFHRELYAGMQVVQMVQERLEVLGSVRPDDEGVVYVAKPGAWTKVS